jgi:hypothetical protein
MGDDGPGCDQGAQSEQLASNYRFERLDKVIRVDSRVNSAELPGRREPLEPTGFALIVSGEPQRHVANLRASEVWEAILVAILHIKCRLCRKSAHNGAVMHSNDR